MKLVNKIYLFKNMNLKSKILYNNKLKINKKLYNYRINQMKINNRLKTIINK